MAHNNLNLNFNLRKPSATIPTPINLVIRYNNEKFIYPTAENIIPKNWQGDKTKKKSYQRAKANSFNDYSELNARLENIENAVTNVFRKYKNDNQNAVPTVKKFRELLDVEFKKKSGPIKSLIPFIKQFIEDSKKRTNPKNGKLISTHTIKKYQTTLNHLEDFIKHTGNKLDFEDITNNFRTQYIGFLNSEYNLATNSIGKDIAVLKAFLNNATENDINKHMHYKGSKFTATWEKADSIYLDDNDLLLLAEIDFTKNKTLQTVRDLFLIGCYTGLRYSDFSIINSKNIVNDKLVVNTFKTGETVVIPVHDVVKEIFEKYDGKLPRCFSNQKTNDYLKQIGEKIDSFKVILEKKITKGGVRQILKMEKYKMITTHTARRSFATNLYKSGFPPIEIMKITGHRTESSFMRYIKVAPEETANRLQAHWDLQATKKLHAA